MVNLHLHFRSQISNFFMYELGQNITHKPYGLLLSLCIVMLFCPLWSFTDIAMVIMEKSFEHFSEILFLCSTG